MRGMVYFSILLSLVFGSCSSSRLVLNKEYSRAGSSLPASIAIVLLEKDVVVHYDGNVEPEFGPGDQDSLILSFFKKQLPEDIREHTGITKVTFLDCSVTGYYSTEMVKTKEGQVEVSVPAAGATVECSADTPDLVLFIKELYIGTQMETTYNAPIMGGGGMMMGGSHTDKKLKYHAVITLWDTGVKQPVLYGYAAEAVSGFFPVITMNEWLGVSSGFTGEIFSKTPFARNEN